MRPSPHRHTLAVLRTFLGLTQKEMANILGCSTPTIQAIELKKLPLSDKLADRIRYETGIDLAWLLGGNPSAPMIGLANTPYTKETFEICQASSTRRGSTPGDPHGVETLLSSALVQIQTMILESYDRDKLDLFSFKLQQALQELRKELGLKEDSKFEFRFPHVALYPDRYRPRPPQRLGGQVNALLREFEDYFFMLYKQKPKASVRTSPTQPPPPPKQR